MTTADILPLVPVADVWLNIEGEAKAIRSACRSCVGITLFMNDGTSIDVTDDTVLNVIRIDR